MLGTTGRNFAAGMSGGVAYVFDEDHDLYLRVNKAMVTMDPLTEEHDVQELRRMLTEHVRLTGSPRGRELLADFEERIQDFKKIIPRDYAAMAERIARYEARGMSREEAELLAFTEKGG